MVDQRVIKTLLSMIRSVIRKIKTHSEELHSQRLSSRVHRECTLRVVRSEVLGGKHMATV